MQVTISLLAVAVSSVSAECFDNVTKILPCGINSCYVSVDFEKGCTALGGGNLKTGQGASFCVVKGAASQVQPCGGTSCYLDKFEEGCESVGGFISGHLNQPPAGAICTLLGTAHQFGPCPAGTGTCFVEKGFEDTCTKLGGFIDGYKSAPPNGPSCTVAGPYSWFKPCNGSTGGCSYSTSEFTAACNKIGGVITGTADGLPVCMVAANVATFDGCSPDPRDPCVASGTAFVDACRALNGTITGSTGTPLCIVTV
eukprot:m.20810 g.20810  ORF g.20810 m.20810 type:complete len:255 (-) comp3830_c0_seq1:127-891(-)